MTLHPNQASKASKNPVQVLLDKANKTYEVVSVFLKDVSDPASTYTKTDRDYSATDTGEAEVVISSNVSNGASKGEEGIKNVDKVT